MKKPPAQIMPYIMFKDETVHKAYYYLSMFKNHKIVIVVDQDYNAVGILTPEDFSWQRAGRLGYDYMDHKTVGEICNRNYKFIREGSDQYAFGSKIFADSGQSINDIPVLDQDGVPVDILSRWQAFFREHLKEGKLQRTYYAEPILSAAELAARKGYSDISVIEFGVAGGTGLVLAELYAKEAERLTGVKIQTYGFDTGVGLPVVGRNSDTHFWKEGDYPMDYNKLQNRLLSAKLVMGDIKDTSRTFFNDYHPAPIGAMLIDVDIYSSTVPILDMLLESDDYFLPTVYMYFDDITYDSGFQGEALAIKEFNAKSEDVKIVPEEYTQRPNIKGTWRNNLVKQCRRFSHSKYGWGRSRQIFLNIEA